MDLFKQGMKGPTRPAPRVPVSNVNRYSPVTNWNDDPFGADVFEPTPQYAQKKQPPPRPPPPKVKHPDVPVKPSHFVRKPTVLSSLLSRKKGNNTSQQNNVTNQTVVTLNGDLDAHKMFPKCEVKNIQTGTLIDLSSPPSSPTFTTRSSSDGLSVDSFGSDATTSTNHHNVLSGGNASQAESGFEDDFDLFLHSRKGIAKEDTFEDFTTLDPFSPQPVKPALMKKPTLSKDLFDLSTNGSPALAAPPLKGPTIIRAKPARPKPPDNSALLRNTFGNSFPVTSMNVNTTTPIQKVWNGFGDSFDSKPLSWDDSSPERESSPPMPSVPPPPPPPAACSEEHPVDPVDTLTAEEPYAIALYNFFTDHPDDLDFSANSRIKLIKRLDAEWLYGSVKSGAEGLFPANYVEIKVPLPGETVPALTPAALGTALALYDLNTSEPGDLRFTAGDTITVLYKINDEWCYGECNGLKGQFPVTYVQMC